MNISILVSCLQLHKRTFLKFTWAIHTSSSFVHAQALNEYFYAHVVCVQLHMCAFLKFKSSCTICMTGVVEISHAVTLSQVLYMCDLCYYVGLEVLCV